MEIALAGVIASDGVATVSTLRELGLTGQVTFLKDVGNVVGWVFDSGCRSGSSEEGEGGKDENDELHVDGVLRVW